MNKIALNKSIVGMLIFMSASAEAMELDWSGQFRAEYNLIHNYSLDSTDVGAGLDSTRNTGDAYYIPGGGSNDANFETLFLKLKPKLVVNDNIYIRSELWFGDPVYGMFGNAVPFSSDQRQFYSNQSRGSTVSAQRFWAEILSDLGTFQIGRAPLHWGLGIVWNSGDGLWDRYESTGDVIRLVSKFGAFSFTPAFVSYSSGNNLGGACNSTGPGVCTPGVGSGGVADYSLMFKYENPDEDFEGGLNFIKRLAGAGQDATAGYQGILGSAASMNYNIWDIFGRKKLGRLTLSGEAPITSGSIGSGDYSTFAIATQADLKLSDSWELQGRFGHAPGQPSLIGTSPDRIKIFYFNPAYRLGMVMFNYNLRAFAGPNTVNNPNLSQSDLLSPYDNPIVNANYMALTALLHANKWTFHGAWIYASAIEAAVAGESFYNTWEHKIVTNTSGQNQSKGLGWEMDFGATMQWDESFQFGIDSGFFFPGDFYKFANVAGVENQTSTAIAVSLRAGVNF